MKIWRFYKTPENTKIHVDEKDMKQMYPLYAVTQSRKMAKKFKEQRNMNKFIEKCSNVDDEISDQFIMANRSKMILEDYFETVIEDERGNADPVFIKVVHTENEQEYLTELTDSSQILNMVSHYIPTEIFTDSIREDLVRLKYHEFVNYRNEGIANSPDGVFMTSFQFDMFRTFMLIYGDTFKPEYFKTISYKTEFELSESDWLNSMKNG